MTDLFWIESNEWDDVYVSETIETYPEEYYSFEPKPPEQKELFDWGDDLPF